MSRASATGEFVGRRTELSQLEAALEDALSGRGRLVMLLGEPGIGKTRTAQELAARAIFRGAQVLWGRCYENMRTPPYWPWEQAIRSYVHEHEPEQLRSEMGTGAANIAEIVSDLREVLPDLRPRPALDDPQQARLRLFDSITTFLKDAAQTQPLVLILDNLHWADRPSLLLLEFLFQELSLGSLLVIGTYRDVDLSHEHPLSQTLGELTKEPRFQRIPLRGLIQEEVGNLIELVAGIAPPQELVEAIYRQTEGNPLFVTEAVRLLLQEGELSQDPVSSTHSDTEKPWTIRLPEGVKEATGRRLTRLSDDCNRVLTSASLVGRVFGLDQLEKLVPEHSQDKLLESLEEALGARIIEEVPYVVGRYQFTHALIQNTLSDRMSAVRRARLHGQIGEALEELYGDDIAAHATELAYHFAEAGPVIGSEKLVRYSLVAGEQALAGYAWEEALEHFERSHGERQDRLLDVETVRIVSGLGHALTSLGEYQQGTTLLKRAFAYYAEVRDVERAVAILEYPHALTPLQLMEDNLSQAIDLVPTDSLQSARLLCSYGLATGRRRSGYVQGQEAFEKSLAIARREGDMALEISITAASANVEAQHAKWDQSLEKSLRALALATHFDAPIDKMRAHQWACNSLFINGDPKGALEHADDLFAIAESLRNDYWLQIAFSMRHILTCLTGNWEELHELSHRYTNVWSVSLAVSIGVLAMARFHTGDIDKGKEYMNSMTGEREFGPDLRQKEYLNVWSVWSFVAGSLCYISGETGLLADVEKAARDAISSQVLQSYWALDAHAALALVVILRNDASAAAKQYSTLKAHANTVLKTGAISLDRLLGLLANVIGNPENARRHFEDAMAFCRNGGYRPELAWSCFDYANMLVETGHESAHEEGDPKSTDLLDEALSIATELGMHPLVRRVITLKERVETLVCRAEQNPSDLTTREIEVLRLVADGKTNREIAEELILSIRTVQRHIYNLYAKINVRNRVEATAYAIRELPTSPQFPPST